MIYPKIIKTLTLLLFFSCIIGFVLYKTGKLRSIFLGSHNGGALDSASVVTVESNKDSSELTIMEGEIDDSVVVEENEIYVSSSKSMVITEGPVEFITLSEQEMFFASSKSALIAEPRPQLTEQARRRKSVFEEKLIKENNVPFFYYLDFDFKYVSFPFLLSALKQSEGTIGYTEHFDLTIPIKKRFKKYSVV